MIVHLPGLLYSMDGNMTFKEIEDRLEELDRRRLAGEAWSRAEAKRLMTERNRIIAAENKAAREEGFALIQEVRELRRQRAVAGAAGIAVSGK